VVRPESRRRDADKLNDQGGSVKRLALLFRAVVLGIGAAAPVAFADQPPGQLGYEGQPGNQNG